GEHASLARWVHRIRSRLLQLDQGRAENIRRPTVDAPASRALVFGSSRLHQHRRHESVRGGTSGAERVQCRTFRPQDLQDRAAAHKSVPLGEWAGPHVRLPQFLARAVYATRLAHWAHVYPTADLSEKRPRHL